MVPIIGVYLLFITFTCPVWGSVEASPQAAASRGSIRGLSFQQVLRLLWTANQGRLSLRSRTQFGVAPHLGTNFRVSRTPNRKAALPWKQLTAKSTVYSLMALPPFLPLSPPPASQPITAVLLWQEKFRISPSFFFWGTVKQFILFAQRRHVLHTHVRTLTTHSLLIWF